MAKNNFDKVTFERDVHHRGGDEWKVGIIRGERVKRPYINSPRLRDVDLFVVNGVEYDGTIHVYWNPRHGLRVGHLYVSRLNSLGVAPTDAANAALYGLLEDPRAVEAFAPPTEEEQAAEHTETGRALADSIIGDVEHQLRAPGLHPAVRAAAAEALAAKLRELAVKLEA